MTPTSHPVEHRWYEVRDADVPADLTRIRILAVPYGTWANLGSGAIERVTPHAPDKSIREAARGLPLLLFHNNAMYPIGKSVKWELNDPAGLIGEWALDTDDTSQEAARKARDGYLTGASIGFQAIRSERVWNDEDDWDDAVSREIAYVQITRLEIRLVEVSLTPTPAYVDAGVQEVRSIQAPRPGIVRPRMDARTQLAIADFHATAGRRR
jgi:HK97 family phage prohead protease